MGRGAPVRRLSGAAAGARGSIPIPSEPPLAAETGHEKRADMPNQHLGWNSVTRRPLAPPRPDWPVRRGLPSNPSATATRGRRPSSPRPTLRRISARIVIAITRLLRRPARSALPARLPRRFSALAVVESGQRGPWLHRGNGCSVRNIFLESSTCLAPVLVYKIRPHLCKLCCQDDMRRSVPH